MKNRKLTGRQGEELAERYLRETGFEIYQRNWRCPWGELDIVAGKEGCLVFIEVRTRMTAKMGTPEESVTSRKQHTMARAIQCYLQEYEKEETAYRADVIAIELNTAGDIKRLSHLENVILEAEN